MKKVNNTSKNNKQKYDGKYYNSGFATILRDLLHKKEFNQEKLAGVLNVTRQTISLYANGNSLPDIETFKKIVNYFKDNGYDYSCDYWLGLIPDSTTNVKAKEINKKYGLSEEAQEKLKQYNKLAKNNKNFTHIKTINLILSQKSSRVWTLIDRVLNLKLKDDRVLAIDENGKAKISTTLEKNSTNYLIEDSINGADYYLLTIALNNLKKEGEKQ